MKKFKKTVVSAIIIIACISIVGCNSEDELTNVGTEQEVYTVKLGWGGELLDVSDTPLTRADTENNDLYGIQIYSTPNIDLEEGQSPTWTPFAYGLFNDPHNISISLTKGYKYKFVASMVKKGTEIIYHTTDGRYGLPFTLQNVHPELTNSFCYSVNSYFDQLFYGKLMFNSTHLIYERPNVDRYYGELLDYIPTNEQTAIIPMKRASFGASFVVVNPIMKEGTVKIELEKTPGMEISLSRDELDEFWASDIYSFYEVKRSFTINEYTETIPVLITWVRNDGAIISLGSHNITYKRNRNTIVTIKITNIGVGTTPGFTIEESEQVDIENMEEGTNITIQDGEIVDTNIEAGTE